MQIKWERRIEISNAVPNIERLVKKYEHQSKNIGWVRYWVLKVEEAQLIERGEAERHG